MMLSVISQKQRIDWMVYHLVDRVEPEFVVVDEFHQWRGALGVEVAVARVVDVGAARDPPEPLPVLTLPTGRAESDRRRRTKMMHDKLLIEWHVREQDRLRRLIDWARGVREGRADAVATLVHQPPVLDEEDA